MPSSPLPVLPPLLLGISTKSYFTHSQTLTYLHTLLSTLPSLPPNVSLFFIPSLPSLISCQHHLTTQFPSSSHPLLGAQDLSPFSAGAHTGDTPATLLLECGASLVEIGHAERRAEPYLESDELIARKVCAALDAGLVPLICVGEKSRPQAKAGEVASADVGRAVGEVLRQVGSVMGDGIGLREGHGECQIVFAYEPVWAIGAQAPASGEYVCAVVRGIRKGLGEMVDRIRGKVRIRILYGGSAGPGTWRALRHDLDGLFLGRFAHDVNNVKLVLEEMLQEE